MICFIYIKFLIVTFQTVLFLVVFASPILSLFITERKFTESEEEHTEGL